MKPYYQDEWVTIYNGDCREILPELPMVDLVVTSPPYDNLRDYGGCSFDFNIISRLLYERTAEGGVVVWVVGDATVGGSETGTSFRHALKFMEIGYNLHDTMIYRKGGQGATGSNNSYWQDFEYMFVFTRGKIKTFNPLMDRKNAGSIKTAIGAIGHRHANGKVKGQRLIKRYPYGKRFNVWEYHESGTRTDHPAVFPLELASDHIISWSNPNDLILDPFLGSGTTAYCAKKLNRKCIGIEIEEKYCEIAAKRCSQQVFNFNDDKGDK